MKEETNEKMKIGGKKTREFLYLHFDTTLILSLASPCHTCSAFTGIGHTQNIHACIYIKKKKSKKKI